MQLPPYPSPNALKRIAFIGSYLPRQCGLATFNADLLEALSANYPEVGSMILAVNEPKTQYLYPDSVVFQFEQEDILSYRAAAKFLNQADISLACLQHEFGLYGSTAGSRILSLLRDLDVPVVTVLHTILQSPDLQQRRVLFEISEISNRIIAMTKYGVAFLREIYKIPDYKIALIPHGTPEWPRGSWDETSRLNVDGKIVLLTYGLLSPNKGIEYAIRALPAIIKTYPNVVYVIAGATHPNIIRQGGESYRQYLQQLARLEGVTDHVHFDGQFLDQRSLLSLIDCAHICITPYLNKEQIVSGTLAYMISRGKRVISTPYWHATEISTSSPVTIVPFRDSHAISEAVFHLLGQKSSVINDVTLLDSTRSITSWTEVAHQYMSLFREVKGQQSVDFSEILKQTDMVKMPSYVLPELRLDHLLRLTDQTGLFQHAKWHVPNYTEGYTTDDNARALIVCLMLKSLGLLNHEPIIDHLIYRYLAFITHAFNPLTGRFRNFMSFERKWLEETGSEEAHGRALWSLGFLVNRMTGEKGLIEMASQLFIDALQTVRQFSSPRAWAFVIMGIHEFLGYYVAHQNAEEIQNLLIEWLVQLHTKHSSPDWPWFENELSWFNARLPHALLLYGRSRSQSRLKEIGYSSLRWLIDIQRAEAGYFRALGTEKFYRRGDGNVPRFDQQPIEASTMISACIEAYRADLDKFWVGEAERIFTWYLGNNDLGLSLYDPLSGGCRDALHPDRVNENQGAESTLAFLMSVIEMRSLRNSLGTSTG